MEFDNWQLDAPIGQWVANDDDLPNLERGLVVSDPSNPDVSWINAYCFQGRRQPLSPDVRENDGERREIWYRTVAFLVPRGSSDQFTQWVLSGQYWEGDGQMGIGDFDDAEGIFFGEYGWSPGFQRMTDGQPIGTIEWCFPTGSDPASAHRVAASCSTTANGVRLLDRCGCRPILLPAELFDCPGLQPELGWHCRRPCGRTHEDSGVRSLGSRAGARRIAFAFRHSGTVTSLSTNLICAGPSSERNRRSVPPGNPTGWLKFQGAYVYRDGTAIGQTNDHFVPNPREP